MKDLCSLFIHQTVKTQLNLLCSIVSNDLHKLTFYFRPYNESTPDCVGIDKDTGQLFVTCDIDADENREENIPPLWNLVYSVTAASEDLKTTNFVS